MLFSTLLHTAVHLAFLIAVPVFLVMAWLFAAHPVNHARAAHLMSSTRPPNKDIRGDGQAAEKWRAMNINQRTTGLREDQALYEGPRNETTLQAITMELEFWRPPYFALSLTIVAIALYWLSKLAFASQRPTPKSSSGSPISSTTNPSANASPKPR
jgi:hypothetical protein